MSHFHFAVGPGGSLEFLMPPQYSFNQYFDCYFVNSSFIGTTTTSGSTIHLSIGSGIIDANSDVVVSVSCSGLVNPRYVLRTEELFATVTARNGDGTQVQSATMVLPPILRSPLGSVFKSITTSVNRAGAGAGAITLSIFPLTNSLIPGDYIQFTLPDSWNPVGARCTMMQDTPRTVLESILSNSILIFPQDPINSDLASTITCSPVTIPILETPSRSDITVTTFSSNNRVIDEATDVSLQGILPPADTIGEIYTTTAITPSTTSTVAVLDLVVNPFPHKLTAGMSVVISFESDTFLAGASVSCNVVQTLTDATEVVINGPTVRVNETALRFTLNDTAIEALRTTTRFSCNGITNPRMERGAGAIWVSSYRVDGTTLYDNSANHISSTATTRNVLGDLTLTTPIVFHVANAQVAAPTGLLWAMLQPRTNVWMSGDNITIHMPSTWRLTDGTTMCNLNDGNGVNYPITTRILGSVISLVIDSGIVPASLSVPSSSSSSMSLSSLSSSELVLTAGGVQILTTAPNLNLTCTNLNNPLEVTASVNGTWIRVADAQGRPIEETNFTTLPYIRPLTKAIGEAVSILTPDSVYAGGVGRMVMTLKNFSSILVPQDVIVMTFPAPFSTSLTTTCSIIHDRTTLEGTSVVKSNNVSFTIDVGSVTADDVYTYITCTDIKNPRYAYPSVRFNVSTWHQSGDYLDATEKLFAPAVQPAPLGTDTGVFFPADPRVGRKSTATLTLRPLSTSLARNDAFLIELPTGYKVLGNTTCVLTHNGAVVSGATTVTDYSTITGAALTNPADAVYGVQGIAKIRVRLSSLAGVVPANSPYITMLKCTEIISPSTTRGESRSMVVKTVDIADEVLDRSTTIMIPAVTPMTNPANEEYVQQQLIIQRSSVFNSGEAITMENCYTTVLHNVASKSKLLRQYLSPDGKTVLVTIGVFPNTNTSTELLNSNLVLLQSGVLTAVRSALSLISIESSTPTNNVFPGTCSNGVIDIGETSVDCGGPTCAQCPASSTCVMNTDCASFICNKLSCYGMRSSAFGLSPTATLSIGLAIVVAVMQQIL